MAEASLQPEDHRDALAQAVAHDRATEMPGRLRSELEDVYHMTRAFEMFAARVGERVLRLRLAFDTWASDALALDARAFLGDDRDAHIALAHLRSATGYDDIQESGERVMGHLAYGFHFDADECAAFAPEEQAPLIAELEELEGPN